MNTHSQEVHPVLVSVYRDSVKMQIHTGFKVVPGPAREPLEKPPSNTGGEILDTASLGPPESQPEVSALPPGCQSGRCPRWVRASFQSCSFLFAVSSLVASSGKSILEAGKGWFLYFVFYPC